MELRLINGKFYRGIEEEKPEIGNVEQIQLLRKQEKRFEMFERGHPINPDIEENEDNEDEFIITASATCVCGRRLHFECTCDYKDEDYLEGVEVSCFCKREYVVVIDHRDNLVVKFNN